MKEEPDAVSGSITGIDSSKGFPENYSKRRGMICGTSTVGMIGKNRSTLLVEQRDG